MCCLMVEGNVIQRRAMDGHYCTGVALVGPREVSLRDMDSYSVFQLVSYRAALCSVSHSPVNSGSLVNNTALPLRIASSSIVVVRSPGSDHLPCSSPVHFAKCVVHDSPRARVCPGITGEFLWSIRVELPARSSTRSCYRNSIVYVSRNSRGIFI